MVIRERLRDLRARMAEAGIAAWIVPSSDPHMSEYPPDHWKGRAWISGFAGSAGTVVVTLDRAGLWTDFRYYLQAERSLAGSGIDLHRHGEPGVADYPDWLASELKRGGVVGCAEQTISLAAFRELEQKLTPAEIRLQAGADLLSELWDDRPALPCRPVVEHDVKYAGESRGEKISALRSRMESIGAGYHLISTLDDIAWLLNLRGSDVEYNPVFLSRLLVGIDAIELFVDPGQVPPELRSELESDGVSVRPYDDALSAVAALPDRSVVVLSPEHVSVEIARLIPKGARTVERMNLTTDAKARKSAVEIEHIRGLMVRDGVAMVRFLHWLGETVGTMEVTELSAERKLREFRAAGALFAGESFRTISAYRGHGAIVHYSASEQTDCRLEPAGIYLIDSGGQYLDGTTDITRTVALGDPGQDERRDFTLVLKGHIGLATTRFPVGTAGPLIDALARAHLWRERMNYGHGTGHGVGFYLNVHEGPQRIAQSLRGVPLEPGMLVSNEPGLYRTDRYGIRIENLVLVVEDGRTEFGSFLTFETLTLCPIDRCLIDVELLTDVERRWVDDYHRRVREKLLGHLDPPAARWLEEVCRPL